VEKALLKLAKQLNAFDEASLMALWEKYSEAVQRFEPSKRWEEAVLVLSMIQGMRFKNQLFNHHWAASREAGGNVPATGPSLVPDGPREAGPAPAPQPAPAGATRDGSARPAGGDGGGKRGKLLRLTPRED